MPPALPGSLRSARTTLSCRRLRPRDSIEQVTCPCVRHDDAGQDDKEQRHRRPKAHDLMPIQFAPAGRQPFSEPKTRPEVFQRIVLGKPEIKTADNKKQKRQIAGPGNSTSGTASQLAT